MATSKDGTIARNLRPHPLTESLLPSPAAHPNAVTFSGFLGRSTKDGFWRLYLSDELDEFLELKADQILHSEQIDVCGQPAGIVRLWVPKDAQLQHVTIDATIAAAEFIQGEILDACSAIDDDGDVLVDQGGLQLLEAKRTPNGKKCTNKVSKSRKKKCPKCSI